MDDLEKQLTKTRSLLSDKEKLLGTAETTLKDDKVCMYINTSYRTVLQIFNPAQRYTSLWTAISELNYRGTEHSSSPYRTTLLALFVYFLSLPSLLFFV